MSHFTFKQYKKKVQSWFHIIEFYFKLLTALKATLKNKTLIASLWRIHTVRYWGCMPLTVDSAVRGTNMLELLVTELVALGLVHREAARWASARALAAVHDPQHSVLLGRVARSLLIRTRVGCGRQEGRGRGRRAEWEVRRLISHLWYCWLTFLFLKGSLVGLFIFVTNKLSL